MPQIPQEIIPIITTYGARIGGALLLLIISYILAGWTKRLVLRASDRAKIDPTLSKFFGNITRYIVLIAAVLTCLGAFGVETTSFAAVLGAAGLAVGLALQGTLANFSAGAMLLIFRPFKVGDVVNVGGNTGKVDEIELFVTRMTTPDNRLLIVPNSTIFGSTIENITAFEERRVDVAVGTDYSADLDETKKVLLEAAKSIGAKGSQDPVAYLTGLGGSSIDWSVRVWTPTADYWAVKEELTFAIKKHLDKAGIGIPFPQMDVHVDQQAA